MLALLWRRRAADAPIASTRRRPRHDWFRTPLLVAHDEAGYRRVVVSSVKKNDGIVELGSHVGVTTALARGLTDGLVVGVEMSEFSVAAARERYADLTIDWMCSTPAMWAMYAGTSERPPRKLRCCSSMSLGAVIQASC